jgi:hypothetical protein
VKEITYKITIPDVRFELENTIRDFKYYAIFVEKEDIGTLKFDTYNNEFSLFKFSLPDFHDNTWQIPIKKLEEFQQWFEEIITSFIENLEQFCKIEKI